MRIALREQTLELGADCLLHWTEAKTLLVADAHWGKGSAFRRAGMPLMESSERDDLAKLSAALEKSGASRVIFLGDMLHCKSGRSESILQTVAEWRLRHRSIEMILVRGNHDRRAGDPPGDWAMECVSEPFVEGPFAFRHYPEPTSGYFTFAGHVHPAFTLTGKGRQRLRLPCFHFAPEVATLPAFGMLTGLVNIAAGECDRIFVIADGEVIAL